MVILVFILGLIPFGIGYALSLLPAMLEGYVAYVTAALFVVIWFFIAKLGKKLSKRTFQATGYLCLAGFIDLLLIVIQLLFTDGFWNNVIGQWTKYFFDPVKALGELIAGFLPEQYFDIWTYVCSFVLILLVALIGALFTKARKVVKEEKGTSSYVPRTDNPEPKRPSKREDVYSGLEALAKKAEESKAELDAKLNGSEDKPL